MADSYRDTDESFDSSLYDELDVASAESISDDDLDIDALAYGYFGSGGSTGEEAIRRAKEYTRFRDAREKSGLTGDRIFDYAQSLKDIKEGKKTEGQLEAEKQLAVLARAQRGRAMGLGGFDSAELMQRAGRSAQQAELTGETAIEQAAVQARSQASSALEQLLIAGEQRAEDRAFAMQQIQFQEEQARGSLFSNVLSGVLGAVGAVVGSVIPGGGVVGAMVGGSIGSSLGGSTGRYLS